jgi:hypothetical protein
MLPTAAEVLLLITLKELDRPDVPLSPNTGLADEPTADQLIAVV